MQVRNNFNKIQNEQNTSLVVTQSTRFKFLNVKNYLYEIIMIFVTLMFIIPIWMVLVNSFKTRPDALSFGLWFPKVFVFENYKRVFVEAHVLTSFFNGILTATLSTLLTIIISSMAAFFIARNNKKFAQIAYYSILSGIIIPIALIPTYIMLYYLKIIDTYLGLILMFVTYGIPFAVFLYTGFIKTISREMDEAAIVDGCGGFRLFFRVVFPLLKPVTITQGILGFSGVWNDVNTQLFFANPQKWSMPMMIYNFYGKYLRDWNVIFADIIITIIPIIVLYVFAQKYIVSGMAAGAVKG